MKKLILLLLITTLAFGQVERSVYESAKRVNVARDLDKITYALYNGVDHYVAPTSFQKSKCVSIFIYPTVTNGAILNFGANLGITYNSSNVVTYGSSFSNTSTYVNGNLGSTLILNQWNHILCLYDEITPTTLEIGRVSTTYFTGRVCFVREWNRQPVNAAEAKLWYNSGRPDLYILPYADLGTSQTDLNNGYNFTSGWTASSATIDNATQFTTTNFGGLIFKNVGINTISKKYRIHLAGTTTSARLQIINASGDVFYDNITGTFDITTECLWVSNTDVRIALRAYTVSGAVTNITTFTVTAIGEVACYRFNEGAGSQVKDYSGNGLHGTLYGTYNGFWQNSPRFYTNEFNLADESISASAATTPISYLPTNVKVLDQLAEVDTAFNTNNTLSLGITGNATWLSTITGTNATGSAFSSPLKQYSPASDIQLYIQKASASTAGRVRLKFYFENLNVVPNN